ncbi:MAG: liaS [Firmicutes bacterium]|nr:liaS [Bacillota bacterium]
MVYGILYSDIPSYIFVLVVMLILAVYVWQYKKTAGAKPHVYGLVCKATWLLCIVLALYYREAALRVFWIYMSCFFLIMMPYIWYIFILEISQQKESSAMSWGAVGITVFNLLAVVSNPWHRLCWQEILVTDRGIVIYMGPLMVVVWISSYLICTLILLLSVRWIVIATGVRRKQALWISIANISLAIGGILEIFKTDTISAFLVSLLVSAVFVNWAFYRWHVYDILPFAKNAVVRNICDAVLVVDEVGNIVKINTAAERVLSGLPCLVGTNFEKLTTMWPALQQLDKSLNQQTLAVTRKFLGKTHYFQLRKTTLQKEGQVRGMVILIKEITLQKQRQEKILEHQKAVAILTERDRISRKVQNSQGKFLHDVKKQVQGIKLLVEKGQLAESCEQLKNLSDMADDAFADVREVISSLKVSAENWNFFKNLEEWLYGFQKSTGIVVTYAKLEVNREQWILPAAEVQLLWIIQEALSIITKQLKVIHLGMTFINSSRWLNVTTIAECGDFGLEARASHFDKFGLYIIEERAKEIGGSCTLRAAQTQKVIFNVRIPLAKAQGEIPSMLLADTDFC